MRNIIIFGSIAQTSLENKYLSAFKKLKEFSKIYDTDLYFPKFFKKKFLNNLFLYPRIFFNSLLLLIICLRSKNKIIIIFKGQFFLGFIINYLKNKNKHFFVNINGDDPFNFSLIDISTKNLIRSLSSYDLVFTWSKNILRSIKGLKLECKIEYLPFAYDEIVKNFAKRIKREKVIFYGSWDLNREKFLNELKNDDVHIFGDGWKNCSFNFFHRDRLFTKEINRKKILKEISKSYAVINMFRKQNYSSHNMKSFEIPAYGGIQFSEYSKELESFFKKNKSIFFYRSAKDLTKKLKIFKKKKKFDQYIKYALESVSNQSYKERAKKVLDYVYKYKKN